MILFNLILFKVGSDEFKSMQVLERVCVSRLQFIRGTSS